MTHTFITIHVSSGVELHRQECTMEQAKRIARFDCSKIDDMVELRVINKEKGRVERLSYFHRSEGTDKLGSPYGEIIEEKSWHPYTPAEITERFQ